MKEWKHYQQSNYVLLSGSAFDIEKVIKRHFHTNPITFALINVERI